jgi:hypothetical protein
LLSVAPSDLALNLSDSAIQENGAIALGGAFSDADVDEAHTVAINWGDGSTPEQIALPAGVLSFDAIAHQYLNNPPAGEQYTISVTVADDAGNSTSAEVPITVHNVAPGDLALNLSEIAIDENGTTILSGLFTDPGVQDAHTVAIDWGDGSPVEQVNLPAGKLEFSDISHRFLNNPSPGGEYTISVTVADGDSGSISAEVPITVRNVAPSIVSYKLSSDPVDEGRAVTLSGVFADPGMLDTHSVTVDWGDGRIDSVPLGEGVLEGSIDHVYAEGGPGGTSYAISVTVADDDGQTASQNGSIVVNNAAPSGLSLSLSSSTIDENGTTILSGSFVDPGVQDAHTVNIDWGDGSPVLHVVLPAGTLEFDNLAHQYLNNPLGATQYTIGVSVTDDDGGSASASVPVTVSNVAPGNVSLELSASLVNENGTTVLSGTFGDPGTLDAHTVSIDWGDGSPIQQIDLPVGTLAFGNLAHRYLNNLPLNDAYTVTVTVADKDGMVATQVVQVTVENVGPVLKGLVASPTVVVEGSAVKLSGVFADPGTQDTHSLLINWGDRSRQVVSLPAGALRFDNVTHAYADAPANGRSYGIQVTLLDQDGMISNGAQAVTVVNAAPVVATVSLSQTAISENDTVTVTGTVTDPGLRDKQTVTIDWGDGSTSAATVTQGAGTASFSATHTYLDDMPKGTPSDVYTITIVATDSDGAASAPVQRSVTVNNAAPVLNSVSFSPAPVNPKQFATLSATLADAGTLDAHVATINWGDGASATYNYAPGVTSLTQKHAYASPGIYTVTLTLQDDDSASVSMTQSCYVTGAAVRNGILQIVGTAGDDEVTVSANGTQVQVMASFLGGRTRTRTFDVASMKLVEMALMAGSDQGTVSASLALPALLDGGTGNDALVGGGRSSILLGGDGNDVLIGGRARDLLIGGLGSDLLDGRTGDNIIIDGTTAYDSAVGRFANDTALLAIIAEWNNPNHGPAVRKANLSGPGDDTRLNGDYFLQLGVTVFNDTHRDRITKAPAGSSNWLFLGPGDLVQ